MTVPDAIAMYLNEQKVNTLHDAAVLTDEFALTHQVFSRDPYILPVALIRPVFIGRSLGI